MAKKLGRCTGCHDQLTKPPHKLGGEMKTKEQIEEKVIVEKEVLRLIKKDSSIAATYAADTQNASIRSLEWVLKD